MATPKIDFPPPTAFTPVNDPCEFSTTDECDGVADSGEDAVKDAAEYTRLKEEMNKLAGRGAWKGVEQDFQIMLGLKSVTINSEVYALAAEAARNLGNIETYAARLQTTIRMINDEMSSAKTAEEIGVLQGRMTSATQSISQIHQNFGLVNLTVPDESFTITPDMMPFFSDHRASIDFANAQLAREKKFVGYLPVGVTFTVSSPDPKYAGLTKQFSLQPMGDGDEPKVYLPIEIEDPKIKDRLAKREDLHRLIRGEFGLTVGQRAIRPTYGTDYTMSGTQSGIFAGSYANIDLKRVLIRPGLRLNYSTVIASSEEQPYAMANSSLTPSANTYALYTKEHFGFGLGASISYPFNFTEQGDFSPVIGDEEYQTRVGVGSANVPLTSLEITQTPVLGGAVMLQVQPGSFGPITLEAGYQLSTIGITGAIEGHPEWQSAAPFSDSLAYATLGVGF